MTTEDEDPTLGGRLVPGEEYGSGQDVKDLLDSMPDDDLEVEPRPGLTYLEAARIICLGGTLPPGPCHWHVYPAERVRTVLLDLAGEESEVYRDDLAAEYEDMEVTGGYDDMSYALWYNAQPVLGRALGGLIDNILSTTSDVYDPILLREIRQAQRRAVRRLIAMAGDEFQSIPELSATFQKPPDDSEKLQQPPSDSDGFQKGPR